VTGFSASATSGGDNAAVLRELADAVTLQDDRVPGLLERIGASALPAALIAVIEAISGMVS